MTDGDGPAGRNRFEPVRRAAKSSTAAEASRARFIECLDEIDAYLQIAVTDGRSGFEPRTGEYAAGTIAIVRTAALFEVDDFAAFLSATPPDAQRGIRQSRNIAGHAGYTAMDDDVLWTTLTVHLPALLTEWRSASQEARRSSIEVENQG